MIFTPVHAQETTTSTEATQSGGIGAGLDALGVNGKLLAAQIVNFIILAIILQRFVYRPIMDLLDKRREQIEKSVKQSEEIETKYNEFQVEHKKQIDEAKAEATEIIEKAKKAAEELRQEHLAATQKETDGLIARAKEEIAREKETMLNELKHEIGGLVVEATAKIIGKEIDAKSQQKLIDETIAKAAK